jgi:hypothetical protein
MEFEYQPGEFLHISILDQFLLFYFKFNLN